MSRLTLPPEIMALHEAFGRKKLRGQVGEIAAAFIKTQGFSSVAYYAKKLYGLTPRQIAIHFALACILTPRFMNGSDESKFSTLAHPLVHANRMMAVQSEHERLFWSRIW